jgi:hypothetical protein
MAVSATVHCLTGCAIGEILGLIIGTALGLDTLVTIILSVGLAFLFGYTLSTLPLLKSGLTVAAAVRLVLAADTLSIAAMELTDNVVMAAIPGAMNAGLVNPIFWIGMMIALTAAFLVAYPVNKWLLGKGKGHALVHGHHGHTSGAGWRSYIPGISTNVLVTMIVAFMVGGLTVSIADGLETTSDGMMVHDEVLLKNLTF